MIIVTIITFIATLNYYDNVSNKSKLSISLRLKSFVRLAVTRVLILILKLHYRSSSTFLRLIFTYIVMYLI